MNAMQNRSATEDASSHHNGNGGGHEKAFSIGPSKDAEARTLKILGIRARIQEHPYLRNSEKNFGVWLLDRALHPQFKDRDGVVVVSRTVCARHSRVSEDTIDRWNKHLEACGELWIDKLKRPNMWPANRYHFTGLDPKRTDVQHTRDGVYGGNGSRPGPWQSDQRPEKSARKFVPGQKMLRLPGSKQISKPEGGFSKTEGGLWVPGFSQVLDTTTESPQGRRLSVVNHDDSQSLTMTTDSRQPQRLSVVTHNDSQSLPVTTESRHPCPVPVVANPAHIRDSVKSIEPCTSKGEGTPGDGFEQWALSLKSYLPSGLQALKADLHAKIRAATNDLERADWQRRFNAVEERVYGRKVNTLQPKPKPKTVAIVERQPTQEEILEGARYALESGKTNLLNNEQREALKLLRASKVKGQTL